MATGEFNSESLDAKLATLIAGQASSACLAAEHHTEIIRRLDEGSKKMEKHDERIQSLEGSRKYVLGAIGTLGTLTGILEFLHIKSKP